MNKIKYLNDNYRLIYTLLAIYLAKQNYKNLLLSVRQIYTILEPFL